MVLASSSVTAAWNAVGAPGGSGGGGGTTTLTNGVPVTGLSGATGSWAYYKITVPASQTSLVITISGGTHGMGGWAKLTPPSDYAAQMIAWLRKTMK